MYDRAITSAPLRKLINNLITDGVLPNPSTNMQVSAGDGMNIFVQPGFALCSGCMKLEEDQRTLAVQAADATYDRIDTVVLRTNDNDDERICDFYIVQGVPAASPVRPELTRTESIWEIGLADLFVAKNTTAMSNQRITDTRYETERCGIMSAINEFDTTTLYQQIQADLSNFQETEQAEFIEWFGYIKGQLTEDAAGSLLERIEEIDAKLGTTDISEYSDGTVTGIVVDCLKSVSDGKTLVAGAITAQGVETAADAEFTTMANNITSAGTARYNAGVSDADARANTDSTNYKTGYNAGVAATKVGTATAAQVLKGKTFTNASGVGLTGTMTNRGAWKGATTGSGNVTIPAGYHSGSGYVSGSGAYNAGVTAADARVNTSSASYTSGYNAGYSAGAGRTVAFASGATTLTWDSASTDTPFCSTSGGTLTIKKAGTYALVTQVQRTDLTFVNGTALINYIPIRAFSVGDTITITTSESSTGNVWLCFLR